MQKLEPRLAYRSLYAGFQAAAARWPHHPIIRDAGETTNYAQLETASRCFARALLAHGLEPGDRVGIWAVNQAKWVAAGLGIEAAGGVLIPASTRLRAREIGDILRRAGARVLVCDPGFGDYDFVETLLLEDLPDLNAIVVLDDRGFDKRVFGWSDFLRAGDTITDAALDQRIAMTDPECLADILFTSGTTGAPKGVPLTNGQSLLACEQLQSSVTRFVEGDVLAVAFPFAHNAGYRAGWQAAVLFGVTIVPIRNYDAEDILATIAREKVTIMPAVPTLYLAILDHPNRDRYDLSSLRTASTGGASIPVILIERMQALFGVNAVQSGYGLTESAGMATSSQPGDDARTIALTAGRPVDRVELKLVDAQHCEVPRGEQGEIALRGPQVMRGYYQDEAATRAAFTADGFLLTGDVGVLDEGGNLRITDRIKDMYLVGGFNAYPAEIEQQLRRLDGVGEVAVIGIDDVRLGQVGRAFIVRRPGSTLDQQAVIDFARVTMANYKVPRVVTFVDSLPYNGTGKVCKPDLRKWH